MVLFSRIGRRQSLMFVIIVALMLTNLLTVVYYISKLNTLETQSPFLTVARNTNADSFKQCLAKAGISYIIEGNDIKIRAVEQNYAISNCS